MRSSERDSPNKIARKNDVSKAAAIEFMPSQGVLIPSFL